MKWYAGLILCFCFYFSSAQEMSDLITQKMENETAGADDREPEDDGNDQQREYYVRHKMNINTVAPEWLSEVLGITVLQVYLFSEYRRLLGPFINLAELQAVPGWDTETIRRILPFLKLEEDQNILPVLKERFKKGEHSFLMRTGRVLEKSTGFYKNDSGFTPFTGDRQKLMLRYTYRFRNLLQWGFTADKDPGEPLLRKGYKKGFDYYSAHFAIRDFRFIKAFVVGDFHINLGQGLVHWQSMAFKRSAETIQVLRQGNGLKAYNGTDENKFHRGAGIELMKRHWNIILFFSSIKQDGNILTDTTNQFKRVFTSFQTSGLHRTKSEREDKDAMAQQTWGGRVAFNSGRFKIALNSVQYQFNEFILKRNEPYNIYAISGSRWANQSMDYGFSWKNMYFFGEVANDYSENFAFIQGLLASLHSNLDLSIVYRNINKAYRAIHSNAFTENAEVHNEQGIYTGLSFRPKPGWRLDVYNDMYRFPWLGYRADLPSTGNNQLVQLFWKPNKKLETYIRFQKELRFLNGSGISTNLNELVPMAKSGLRFQSSYMPNAQMTIRNRIDVVWFEQSDVKEDGFQAYIDFIYKSIVKPFSYSARLSWFQTSGYNSRIYGYEQDVLYYYAISALFDRGMRFYFLFNQEIHKNVQIWCKLSSSLYTNNKSVGSGLTEILQKHRSEIRFQLLYRF